jgi:hypothetical protein
VVSGLPKVVSGQWSVVSLREKERKMIDLGVASEPTARRAEMMVG